MFRTTNFQQLFRSELAILDYDPPAAPPPGTLPVDTTAPDLQWLTLNDLGERLIERKQVRFTQYGANGEPQELFYLMPMKLEVCPCNEQHWTLYARDARTNDPEAILTVWEIYFRPDRLEGNIIH